jgi:hypothetical protein
MGVRMGTGALVSIAVTVTLSIVASGAARVLTNFNINSNAAASPTTNYLKDQCKDGGWRSLGFKNQGDCVSFFASGGRNEPST